jgi:hypothetical protein
VATVEAFPLSRLWKKLDQLKEKGLNPPEEKSGVSALQDMEGGLAG